MEEKCLPFKSQVEALKAGRYTFEAAKIVVANLACRVESRKFTWKDLNTTRVEMDMILAKLERGSKQLEQ